MNLEHYKKIVDALDGNDNLEEIHGQNVFPVFGPQGGDATHLVVYKKTYFPIDAPVEQVLATVNA